MEETVIIGGGVAGFASAIYTGRAQLKPLLIEGSLDSGYIPGGQLVSTTDVENFPGFMKVGGFELVENMKKQAEEWGTKIVTDSVTKVNFDVYPYKIYLGKSEKPILTKSVIIATGAMAKKLEIPGGDEFWNRGVTACAVCDGCAPKFKRQPVAIVGGGDTAMEDALYMTKCSSKVYIINRSEKFRASKIMLKRVKENPKIEFIINTIVTEAKGDDKGLHQLILKNVLTNETSDLSVEGMFYAIGHLPNSSLFKDFLIIDSEGYIKTDDTKTNKAGIYACGDVQDKKYRQVATAVGTGCMAGINCERWLSLGGLEN